MKVLALISSPNKQGSGAILTKELCCALPEGKFDIDYVYLYDLNFKSCGDCDSPSDIEGFCTRRDDLVPVMQKLVEADLVVWSAPIYLDYISGTAKTFFDRFCIFVNEDFSINRIPGKKFVLIFTCGTTKTESYRFVVDSISEQLTDFFKCEVVGTVLASSQMQFPSKTVEEDICQAKKIATDFAIRY
jgi:multimeric flavodoxin WrbA